MTNYERLAFEWTGGRWRALAREALGIAFSD